MGRARPEHLIDIMKFTAPVILALSAMCSAAGAQSYDAAPVVQAEAGADSSASVSASFDIAAPPTVVWATLIDCEHATRFMPKLIRCKVLQKGPGDRWEIREHKLKGGLFTPQANSRPQQCRWQTTLASPFGPPQP